MSKHEIVMVEFTSEFHRAGGRNWKEGEKLPLARWRAEEIARDGYCRIIGDQEEADRVRAQVTNMYPQLKTAAERKDEAEKEKVKEAISTRKGRKKE